jgi:hypothetical protein
MILMLFRSSQTFTSSNGAKVPGLRATAQWHHAEDVGQDLQWRRDFFGQCQCILTSPECSDCVVFLWTNMGYIWIHHIFMM